VSESTVWVGRATEEERRAFSREGVTLTGYVDDVRPYLAQAACFIVPLRVGGGTRLKILAAWAAGMPVVSTSIGCEGLDARDGWNILVRDDPSSFALAVAQVLADAELRQTLSKNARKTAEDTYSWEAIGASMRPVYARCLEPRTL
jgi:glycosyltransferase involved in cell wall biosynthesis